MRGLTLRSAELPKEVQREQLVLEAYKRATQLLDEDRVKMENFTSIYSEVSVQADLAEVKRLQALFRSEETPKTREYARHAAILEAIIVDQMEMSQWFGAEVSTRTASLFDDYKNGIDLMALIDVDQKATVVTGFGIDVTFSRFSGEKLQRIRQEIQKGSLPTIRYAETNDFQGTLRNQPRVILAMSDENLVHVADVWMNGGKKELANHPMKMQFADQIHTQLQVFREYARKQGKKDIADTYDRQYRIWDGLLKKQNYFEGLDETPAAKTFFENDPTHTSLMQATKDILR